VVQLLQERIGHRADPHTAWRASRRHARVTILKRRWRRASWKWCRASRSAPTIWQAFATCEAALSGHRHGPHQRLPRGRHGQSGREGEPAVGQHLGRNELHGLRPDDGVPLLFIHAFLQTKTTELVDSLEMASVKFLNAVTGAPPEAPAPAAA